MEELPFDINEFELDFHIATLMLIHHNLSYDEAREMAIKEISEDRLL